MKMLSDPETLSIYPQLSDFLLARGDLEKADHFARESLKAFPNDFSNWRRLIQIKIARGHIEKALAILNNAPVTSLHGEGDFYKCLPKPVLISLPGTGGLSSPDSHPSVLEKLKAPGLKGNFREAYGLLVEIYKVIGWDELLHYRSKVFVMERELLGNDSVASDLQRVSLHNSIDILTDDPKAPLNSAESYSDSPAQLKSPLHEPVHFLSLPDTNFLSETGKKLCERWLDNLILILFEDLRIFSLFTEELKRKETNLNSSVNRSLKEWLLVGKLSMRLGHMEESKLAYQKCLFSNNTCYDQLKMINSALTDLIQIYCREGKIQLSILCTLRLLNSQTSLYSYLLHPTRTSFDLCGLIERVGLKRIESEFRTVTTGEEQQESEGKKKLEAFIGFVKDAKVHGYNY